MNAAPTIGSPTYLELISVLISTIWIFALPGYLWSALGGITYSRDRGVAFALALGVGMAFWPVLLLWTSTVGLALPPVIAQILIILLGAGGFLLIWFRHVSHLGWKEIAAWRNWRANSLIWILLAVFLFIATFWTRFSHTRSIVLPNWVDSVHHSMIVRLIVDQGKIPDSFAPFLPVESQFAYHWGYHALVAWLAWARGSVDSFDAIHLMLVSGQVWSMFAVLMLYAAGRATFGSRRAGVWVAIFGGLLSWFPAYYISWGRYTHLAGVLLLAPAAISLWKLHLAECGWPIWLGTSALLAAGLVLIHVRVAFFFVTLAVILAIYLGWQQAWRSLSRWAMSGVIALILCGPWLWRLVNSARVSHRVIVADGAQQAWANQNNITWELVWVPGMNEVFALATAGLSGILRWGNPPSWVVVIGFAWFGIVIAATALYGWRRFQAESSNTDSDKPRFGTLPVLPLRPLLLMLSWLLLTALILNLDAFGLPTLGFMSNDAAVITLFAPVSMIAGGVVMWVLGVLIPKRWAMAAMLCVGVLVAGWGSFQMREIVNPTTTLVQPSDMQALRWIRENVPPDARFAVNTRRWLGSTYAGTDAGYWIPILSERASILPASLYITAVPRAQAVQMNQLFEWWSHLQNLDDPNARAQLRAIGVTHVYLGTHGGHLLPENFHNRPYLMPLYDQGGVQIYQLEQIEE